MTCPYPDSAHSMLARHTASMPFTSRLFLILLSSASRFPVRTMASSQQINLLRLVSASVFAADKAAKVVRDVMKGGNLGIVDKVCMRLKHHIC